MAAEGRELGWEDSIKQDAQDYEPIPEGDYNVTIEKFDRSRSKVRVSSLHAIWQLFILRCMFQNVRLPSGKIMYCIPVWSGSCLSCSVALALRRREKNSGWTGVHFLARLRALRSD